MLSRYLIKNSRFVVDSISSEGLTGPKKLMLYRARQRGWLELDVILGTFADRHLSTMNDKELEQFGEILALENPHLFKLCSGQTEPDEQLKANPVFANILSYVNKQHPSL
jgi:succinate dehydrogenase flavin-adding protein (antitoxin of CptAB toxin-antitoxin module)